LQHICNRGLDQDGLAMQVNAFDICSKVCEMFSLVVLGSGIDHRQVIHTCRVPVQDISMQPWYDLYLVNCVLNLRDRIFSGLFKHRLGVRTSCLAGFESFCLLHKTERTGKERIPLKGQSPGSGNWSWSTINYKRLNST
jgi:hypothetical protein